MEAAQTGDLVLDKSVRLRAACQSLSKHLPSKHCHEHIPLHLFLAYILVEACLFLRSIEMFKMTGQLDYGAMKLLSTMQTT